MDFFSFKKTSGCCFSMIKSTDKANTKMEPEEIVASVETISLV
jgi:hypothetical protein